jgi:phosphatidylglycerophosphate synthase
MVPVTKRIADIITWIRVLIVIIIIGLGFTQGISAIPAVTVLMIFNWTTDSIDGPLARRKANPYQTWIGARDLEVDMLVSASVLAYLVLANLVSWQLALLYVLLWTVFFWRKGITKSIGSLFQAPIYLYFIVITFREEAMFAWAMVIWALLAMAITWPKFPKVILPDFFSGLRAPRKRK